MIRCTLELVPNGFDNPETKEVLGVIEISNDFATSLMTKGERGSYKYKLTKKRQSAFCTGKIVDYPRKAYHSWELVRRILNEAKEKGNL